MSNISSYSTKRSTLIQEKKLDDTSYYLNRELSWIRFNARILEEARDECHPLLERIKFLAICGSNLDEFFMTRMARLIKKIAKESKERSVDGMTSLDQVLAVSAEISPLLEKHAVCWKNELLPALASENITILKYIEVSEKSKDILRNYFKTTILSQIKIFKEESEASLIENLQVYLCVESKTKEFHSIVGFPSRFGRLLKIPQNPYRELIEHNFVFIEDLIINCLDLIFPNTQGLTAYPFRLTRNSEIEIIMDDSDFLGSIKKGLTKRKTGFPSRLEFDMQTPVTLRKTLMDYFNLPAPLTFTFDGPLGLVDLWRLYKIPRPDLKDRVFLPSLLPLLTPEKSLFTTITKRDIVLYHPYDGFEIIIALLKEAAQDPLVEDICITLYRMDANSSIVDALMIAAQNGKKVTAIVELKAKFDEENNILLVSKLRQAGVVTVYNFPNFKVHAKLCLIVRREKAGLVRYSHVGSGNYNAVTAKIYGDIGYLTANPEVGLELEALFHSLINGLQEKDFKHLLVSPKSLKNELLSRIDREIAVHQRTGKGYLAFKLNNLEDKDIVKALYRASMAGIKVELNVRALCVLCPGITAVSENISVISIVGRFLEHARIYYFENGGESELLIGSSDMMIRNLKDRVEVLFSVPDPQIRREIFNYILKIHLKDNVKARKLLSDGNYQRVTPKPGEASINSQFWLIQNRGIWHEYAAYLPTVYS
ncbi:MAG: polyphosphate kinase 1 [Nitrososphaerota archaeon]|nr:polyphosphate kinase 1 [Nitrososphaerota archaeon]